ncbi:MAG: hypothetical protein RIR79_2386 [Pseudomonadota bacterium]|jgi:hypothetical protein
MSLLNWLQRKESNKDLVLAEEAAPPALAQKPSVRRATRARRRELLFSVIADAMNTMDMASPSYKFKVLTLDSEGCQHLVMMDMARELMGDVGRLEEIEHRVIQKVKQKHDFSVAAIYFRANESLILPVQALPPHRHRPRNAAPPPAPPSEEVASTAFPPTSLSVPSTLRPLEKSKSLLQSLKLSGGGLAASWRNRRAESTKVASPKSERNFADTKVEEDTHAASHAPNPTQSSAGK